MTMWIYEFMDDANTDVLRNIIEKHWVIYISNIFYSKHSLNPMLNIEHKFNTESRNRAFSFTQLWYLPNSLFASFVPLLLHHLLQQDKSITSYRKRNKRFKIYLLNIYLLNIYLFPELHIRKWTKGCKKYRRNLYSFRFYFRD